MLIVLEIEKSAIFFLNKFKKLKINILSTVKFISKQNHQNNVLVYYFSKSTIFNKPTYYQFMI